MSRRRAHSGFRVEHAEVFSVASTDLLDLLSVTLQKNWVSIEPIGWGLSAKYYSRAGVEPFVLFATCLSVQPCFSELVLTIFVPASNLEVRHLLDVTLSDLKRNVERYEFQKHHQ